MSAQHFDNVYQAEEAKLELLDELLAEGEVSEKAYIYQLRNLAGRLHHELGRATNEIEQMEAGDE